MCALHHPAADLRGGGGVYIRRGSVRAAARALRAGVCVWLALRICLAWISLTPRQLCTPRMCFMPSARGLESGSLSAVLSKF